MKKVVSHYGTNHQGLKVKVIKTKTKITDPKILTEKYSYPCDRCPKRLLNFPSWAAHIRIHQEDSKIKCPQCSKELPNYMAYESHLKRVHRLKCDQCPLTFGNEASLETHLLKFHPFKCDVCSQEFTKMDILVQGSYPIASILILF